MNHRSRIKKLEGRLPQVAEAKPTIDASKLSTLALRELLDCKPDLSKVSPEIIGELHAARVVA